jgi:hypothetical protein
MPYGLTNFRLTIVKLFHIEELPEDQEQPTVRQQLDPKPNASQSVQDGLEPGIDTRNQTLKAGKPKDNVP